MSISDAELQVMQQLWERHPASSEDLLMALQPLQGWQASTVKTLLGRLVEKGAIRAEAQGRRYLYSPVLQREDWLREQSGSFLERCFGGRLSALVSHFADQRPLSAADREALRALLQEPGRD